MFHIWVGRKPAITSHQPSPATSQVSRATCTVLLTLAMALSLRRQRHQRRQRRCLGLASPKALQPAAPQGVSSGQVELPDFWQYAATLEEAPGLSPKGVFGENWTLGNLCNSTSCFLRF